MAPKSAMRPRRSPFWNGMKGTPSNWGGTACGPHPSAASSSSGSSNLGMVTASDGQRTAATMPSLQAHSGGSSEARGSGAAAARRRRLPSGCPCGRASSGCRINCGSLVRPASSLGAPLLHPGGRLGDGAVQVHSPALLCARIPAGRYGWACWHVWRPQSVSGGESMHAMRFSASCLCAAAGAVIGDVCSLLRRPLISAHSTPGTLPARTRPADSISALEP